jgi:hypothetical protein
MTYGDTDPKNIYIGLIFALIMMLLGFSFLGHDVYMNPANFNDIDVGALNSSLSYMDDLQVNINQTSNAIHYASTEDVGPLGIIGALILAGWTSIKQFYSTITYATAFLTGITGLLGIPAFVTGLIISVITIMVVTWLIYLIFKMR